MLLALTFSEWDRTNAVIPEPVFPTTYEAFLKSDRTVTGFTRRQHTAANRVKPGDTFLCYMIKLSRWFGQLEVVERPYTDDTPLFYPSDVPFVVRFRIKPMIWLPAEKAIPIKEDELWQRLSFTKDHEKGTSAWAQRIKGSLAVIVEEDAALISTALRATLRCSFGALDRCDSRWNHRKRKAARRRNRHIGATRRRQRSSYLLIASMIDGMSSNRSTQIVLTPMLSNTWRS
jgi:hypothetical protein